MEIERANKPLSKISIDSEFATVAFVTWGNWLE